MKKLFFMLGFVLLVALVQASPPPGEMATFDLEEVAVINVDNFDVIELQEAWVLEVLHRPPWRKSVTVNKAPAIEISQELTALITTTTDIEFTLKHPPTLSERKGKLNSKIRAFKMNNQNCNYGYPLSANEQHGNLFFS